MFSKINVINFLTKQSGGYKMFLHEYKTWNVNKATLKICYSLRNIKNNTKPQSTQM